MAHDKKGWGPRPYSDLEPSDLAVMPKLMSEGTALKMAESAKRAEGILPFPTTERSTWRHNGIAAPVSTAIKTKVKRFISSQR